MATLVHVFIFLSSAGIVWFFAGILIESVERVAKHFHKTGFSVAFFVLGILTSISEISVAINATIDGIPQVSAGNLVGASFVILLFIVPFLAVAGMGVGLRNTISGKSLITAFTVIVLPAALVIDGEATRNEGVLMLLAYITLVYAVYREYNSVKRAVEIPVELINKKHATVFDAIKILVGGGAIFVAAHFLVEQAVYFSELLRVPGSLMGLILLSVGTNVPEIVIAARSILKKHKEIAFGDYLGSAAANTLIFAFLPFLNGSFGVEPKEFFETTMLMIPGITLFYFFAKSKRDISRKEGLILLAFYACFLAIQFFNIFSLAKS